MGEIGIERDTFLYELRLWELRSIVRGYRMRQRPVWESSRRMAFLIISAMPYVDIKKAGIFKETDLFRLPWERRFEHSDGGSMPTKEELDALRRELEEEQEKMRKG